MTDWRLPENRVEAFARFYRFHLDTASHPGCVYFALPEIADRFGLDRDQKAWLVWLNGNTQNPITSLLLLNAAPRWQDWRAAVDFWSDNYTRLEWDTDRRYHKARFGEATEKWIPFMQGEPADQWASASFSGWSGTWQYAMGHPYMGRLSAWSMAEYAAILLGTPDADTLLLEDKDGSRSHRNGLGLLAGYDSTYWEGWVADALGLLPELEDVARSLLEGIPGATRLTLESALCTYKSWHKPNRRYPGVYADMMYYRLLKAEESWGESELLNTLWQARRTHLPEYMRLEDSPHDPGLAPVKQNQYRESGLIPVLGHVYPDMWSPFDQAVKEGTYGVRKDYRERDFV